MDNSALLDEYKNNVISTIKEKDIDLQTIRNYLKRINQINEDSFLKQEIAICYYNLQICEEINKHFIVERDGLITNGNSSDQINEIQKEIFQAIITSMKVSDIHQNDQFVGKAMASIRRILIQSIDCDKYEVFNNLIDILDDFFNYSQLRNNLKPCINIIGVYSGLFDYIISQGKRNEWTDFFVSQFEMYTLKSTIHTDEVLIKALCGNCFNNLEKLLENDKFQHYQKHLKNTMSFIKQIIKGNSTSADNFVEFLIVIHTKKILEKNNPSYIEEFTDKMIDFCKYSIAHNYEALYVFLILTIDKFFEKSNDEGIRNKLTESKFNLAVSVLNSESDLNSVFIPNFQEILIRSNFSNETIEDVKDKYYILFRRVLLKKKTGLLLHFIQDYSLIVYDLTQQQRPQQESFIELFFSILHGSISINNREGFYLILDELFELIEKMDKENKISEGLMNYCISMFSTLIVRCVKEKQNELVFSIIERIISLHKNLSIILKKPKLQTVIIEALFQAGLDAVENHNEEVICNVSNHLGWVGKTAIENSNQERLTFILQKATVMFNISLDLGVNKKTIIFIGTLFIVLGGYINACKKTYLPIILNEVRNLKDRSLLIKSKNLRLYESSKWNSLMGGNAKQNIEAFTKRFEKL